jgi:hypothetical protein
MIIAGPFCSRISAFCGLNVCALRWQDLTEAEGLFERNVMTVACKQRFTQGSVGSSEAPCPTCHHAEGTSERWWDRNGAVYASDVCRFRSAADEIQRIEPRQHRVLCYSSHYRSRRRRDLCINETRLMRLCTGCEDYRLLRTNREGEISVERGRQMWSIRRKR